MRFLLGVRGSSALCFFLLACGSSKPSEPNDARPDAGSDSDPNVVTLDSGPVRGTREDGVLALRGIPYAAPPVDEGRWRAPQPVASWTEIRDASKFGAKCVQTTPDSSEAAGGSEDCLTLNVWRPADPAPSAGWPVMFFVHGGYNVRGSSSDELEPGKYSYDGGSLARRGTVVVTINYRVGALGWMAHPAFGAENADGASGNYGMLDQIAALQWVSRNAGMIGADPKRVLVFGQSAGATNTCALVASPLAAGLLSAAAMHSGTCGMPAPGNVAKASEEIATSLGCDGADVAACLRSKPAAAIAAAKALDFTSGGFAWGHVIDGHALPASMGTLIASGRHNHVPLVVSVTAHETTTLWQTAYPKIPVPKTTADHEAAMRAIYGPMIGEKVIAAYPAAAYSSPAFASVAATSDSSFVCPARLIARGVAAKQSEPVRRFYFAHVLESSSAKPYGAGHGFDLLFVFSPKGVSWFTPTPAEDALADAFAGYLTRFAATGDPNGTGAVDWPAYDSARDNYLVLDDTFHEGEGLRTAPCDFWSSL